MVNVHRLTPYLSGGARLVWFGLSPAVRCPQWALVQSSVGSPGCSYRGDFRDNMFEGRGTYTWSDGSSFSGKWSKNRPFDDGKFVNAAGITWVGAFDKVGASAIKPEVF